jgi:hypothetical protein
VYLTIVKYPTDLPIEHLHSDVVRDEIAVYADPQMAHEQTEQWASLLRHHHRTIIIDSSGGGVGTGYINFHHWNVHSGFMSHHHVYRYHVKLSAAVLPAYIWVRVNKFDMPQLSIEPFEDDVIENEKYAPYNGVTPNIRFFYVNVIPDKSKGNK